MRNYISKNNIYSVVSIILCIALWKFLSTFIGNDIIMPSPEATYVNLISIMKSKGFFEAVFNTIIRSLLGFSIALFCALALGVIAGVFKPMYYLLDPIVTTIKATPTIGIILLALIWLESQRAPILIGFLIIFPIMYSNVVEGIYNVDSDLIEMANIYKVKKWRILREIYIPSILSYLMAGISTSLSLNLKIVIAAEVLSQSLNSIGDNLYMEKIYLNTAGVFAWIIVAIVISWFFEIVLRGMYKRVVKWK